MDYFEAAVNAKRNKDFDLALKYYEMEMKEEGLSVNLLTAIAKVYYLKKELVLSTRFYLAAAHLSMHLNYHHFMRGDRMMEEALHQIPQEIRSQLPHEIAGLVFLDSNLSNHIAHAYMDTERIFEVAPHLRPYAEIYYASVLGNGSDKELYKKYNITPEEYIDVLEKEYIPMGIKILLEQIKWNQIQNSDVYSLYFS